MLLNESGIRLPKGIKSAKICTHSDLDGFVSGLLLYNQLIRQGIPADRINIKFVQYGENENLDKATRKNKTQALLSSDFSAYPVINMEEKWNSFAKSYNKEENKTYSPKGNASFDAFKPNLNKKPSFKTISDFLKENNPNALLLIKPKDSSVRIAFEDFMNAWKAYDGGDTSKVSLTDLDYTSDHHSNEKGDLVPGKSGKIGADYRSDAEHIATVAAQNLMNWDDIEAVSRVDSATYKNPEDVLMMPSALKSKERKERMAILVSTLVNSIIKSSERMAELLIKRSTPSLISIYNNALKIAKLTDNELKVLSELKNDKPDWNLIDELTKDLPGYEKKKLLQQRSENKAIKPINTIQGLRDKNEKNIQRETKLDKSDYKFYGNVAYLYAKNTRDQPSRYLFAFLEHEGKQPAFVVRKLPGVGNGMIQFSSSPLLKPDEKAKIDLEIIGKEALDAAEKEGLLNDFAKNLILQKSGGHKTIYNLSNLNIVGNLAPSPNERYKIKDLTDYEKRRKAIYNRVKSGIIKRDVKPLPNKSKELEQLSGIKTAANEKLYDFLIDYIIKAIRAEYGNLSPKSDLKFKVE